MWPLRAPLKYHCVERWPANEEDVRCVSVLGFHNEKTLIADIEDSLDQARAKEIAILIFPELIMTETAEALVREILRDNGVGGFPILTIYGCCHRLSDDGHADVNEAVLLGPDGEELCRHRKLTEYNVGKTISERLEAGTTMTVLECAFGNLLPLICLDLLNHPIGRIVEKTHGNVLLVPSLSPKTGAHAKSAALFGISSRACTFVCNRCFGDFQPTRDDPEGSSFYRAGKEIFHYPDHGDRPYLLFELQKPAWLDSSTTAQLYWDVMRVH